MKQPVIRRAAPSDALAIALVQAYTWKTTYAGLLPEAVLDAMLDRVYQRAQRWKEDLEQSENCFAAELDGVVIGFASYGESRSPDVACGEIYGLYVLKPFQGQGVGKLLLAQCSYALRRLGCDSFLVNCLMGNPSLGFYEAMGGTVVGTRQDRIGETAIQEHILRFSLDGVAE